MTIREAKIEDIEQVEAMAEKYGLCVPYDGKLLIAENEGKIKAFVNVRTVTVITPFVSENPMIGKKLWDYVEEKFQKGGIRLIQCITKEKNINLFKRLGFNKVFGDQVIMEKIYREV